MTALRERFQGWEHGRLEAYGARPRVGILCTRVPPELVEAAGALPVRLLSPKRPPMVPIPDIRPDACSFCRSVPAALAADERYRGLAGIIAGACCDQMRRLMDTLEQTLDIPVIIFGAPRTWDAGRDYFLEEMRTAFRRLGDAAGFKVDPGRLPGIVRERRRLQERLLQLRREGCLPAGLLQALNGSPLPPGELLRFLEQIEGELQPGDGIRVMLTGSIPGGWETEMLESAGANVVADATCLGDRAFPGESAGGDDLFGGLFDRYAAANLCPHRRPVTPLLDYLKSLAAERRVEGVVYRSVKYCHPWGLAADHFRDELNLPFLSLDDDLTSLAAASLRTRIEAFIEMLTARRRRRVAS